MSKQPYYTADSFEPWSAVGYLIKRVHKMAHAVIEDRFSDLDISFSQWIALTLVKHEMSNTCSSLARYLGHDNGSTTRLIDSLESNGLMTRVRCPDDRRVVRLKATPEGMRVAAELTPRVMDIWNELLGGYSKPEVDQFIAMLRSLVVELEARSQEDES